MVKRKHKYGEPVMKSEIPEPTKRLPQYSECLTEFLESESDLWKVNIKTLPSRNIRVIISSLKWRTKNFPQFKNINVFMRGNEVYLEKVKDIEPS
jgi:hypothetical protein